MPEYCQPCQEAGRKQVAHVLGPPPMCFWHRDGKPHPEELARRREIAKVQEGKISLEVEEKNMPRTKGIDPAAIRREHAAGKSNAEIARALNIGNATVSYHLKKLGLNSHSKRGRRPADGAGSALSMRGRRKHSQSHGALLSLTATPELCDAVWAALSLEKKASLLNKLAEV
jgi:DNA-binding MarR family transcriptional regulator